MSILIKGMEMPKNRGEYELLLYVDSDGTATVEGSYCRFEGEPFEAISVPTHGRLIDADAFDERIRIAGGLADEELTDDFKDGIQTTLLMLKTQKTIIPAEEGE